MTIGQVAKRAGVGVETVRFYERQGLLEPPPRRPSGYRDYATAAVKRIRFIRRGRELGFTLPELGELLALRSDPGRSCLDVRRKAEARLADIEDKIRTLQRMKRILGQLVQACDARAPTRECPILDALGREAP
jgi:MerR family mercuric resistance operon transcriptional regulator